jgi:1,6-anhydro-N-acetylmuramate kinase
MHHDRSGVHDPSLLAGSTMQPCLAFSVEEQGIPALKDQIADQPTLVLHTAVSAFDAMRSQQQPRRLSLCATGSPDLYLMLRVFRI